MAVGRVTPSSADLIIAAVDSAEEAGLTYSEIARKIGGMSGSTIRVYANALVGQGILFKKYEQNPGRPYDPPRCRLWLPKYYAE